MDLAILCQWNVLKIYNFLAHAAIHDQSGGIDEGRIIGLGTHDELMDTCPEYKEISDSQMGGAIVE